MRKEDKINVNGIQITVKELTVAEVRHWMMDIIEKENQKDDVDVVSTVLDQRLFEEIGLSDICRMTDLESNQLDDFTPSQLQVVIQRCKMLNSDFFGMRKRVLGTALKSA